MGEAEAARTQIKAQGTTFTQPLLREGTELGDLASLSVTETIRAITPSLHLLSAVGRESGKKMGPARWGRNLVSQVRQLGQPSAAGTQLDRTAEQLWP